MSDVAGVCSEAKEKQAAIRDSQKLEGFDIDALDAEIVALSAATEVNVEKKMIAPPGTGIPATKILSDAVVAAQMNPSYIEADFSATDAAKIASPLCMRFKLDGEREEPRATDAAPLPHELPVLFPAEKERGFDMDAFEAEVKALLAASGTATKKMATASPTKEMPESGFFSDAAISSTLNPSTTETEVSACEANEEAMAVSPLCSQFDLRLGVAAHTAWEMAPRSRKLLALLRAKHRRSLRVAFDSLESFCKNAIAFGSQAHRRALDQRVSEFAEHIWLLEEEREAARANNQRVEQAGRTEVQRVKQAASAETKRVQQDGRAKVQRIKQAGREEVQRIKQAGRAEVQRIKQAGRAEVKRLLQAGKAKSQRIKQAHHAEAQRIKQAGHAEAQRIKQAGHTEAKRVRQAILAEGEQVPQEVVAEAHQVQQAVRVERRSRACRLLSELVVRRRRDSMARAVRKMGCSALRNRNEETREYRRGRKEAVKSSLNVRLSAMEASVRDAESEFTFKEDFLFFACRYASLRPRLHGELLAAISKRKSRLRHLPQINKVPGAGAPVFIDERGGSEVRTCAKSQAGVSVSSTVTPRGAKSWEFAQTDESADTGGCVLADDVRISSTHASQPGMEISPFVDNSAVVDCSRNAATQGAAGVAASNTLDRLGHAPAILSPTPATVVSKSVLDDLNANARPLAVATVRVSLPTAMSCCPAAPDAVGCASPNAQLETVPAGTDGHISNYASATSSCLATPDSLGCASSKAGLEAVTAGTKKRFSRHASVERMVAPMCKVMQKWNISLISIVLAQVKTYAALNAGAEEAHWPTTVGMFTLGSAARGSKKRESEMREIIHTFCKLESCDRGHFLTWLGRVRREKDKALASRSKEPQEKVCGRQTGEEIDARNDSEADGNLPTRVGKVGATGGGDKTNGTFVFGSGTSPFSLSGTFGVTDAYVGSIEDAGSMPNRDEVTTLERLRTLVHPSFGEDFEDEGHSVRSQSFVGQPCASLEQDVTPTSEPPPPTKGNLADKNIGRSVDKPSPAGKTGKDSEG